MDDLVGRLRKRKGFISLDKGAHWHMVNEPDADAQEAADMIERLRAALQRVIDHDPKTPGLHYDSIEQLLDSVIAYARSDLEPRS